MHEYVYDIGLYKYMQLLSILLHLKMYDVRY